MQARELLKYIENPNLLTRETVPALQQLVKDFPYFQSAHVLLSMASKKWDASAYQQSLKKTAIVVSNRSHLFNLIHGLEMPEVHTESTQKTEEPKVVTKTISLVEADTPEPVLAVELNKEEETKQQLDILKAAEVAAEANTEELVEKQKPVLNAEEILEKEIQNQVVNSFVEKEILKIPELHHAKPKADPESFTDWLNLLKKNNGQTPEQIQEQVTSERLKNQNLKPREEKKQKSESQSQQQKREKHKAIIDKIIETSPGLIRSKEDQKFFAAEIKAKESLLENEHLVTETLARIYALQGSVNKAVRAYEILSLKYPQKSAYFANLIHQLKNNQ